MTCLLLATEDIRHGVLARILESVCQPLKLRVEQVLVSDPGTFILFKLTTLLKFYHSTIRYGNLCCFNCKEFLCVLFVFILTNNVNDYKT